LAIGCPENFNMRDRPEDARIITDQKSKPPNEAQAVAGCDL
jgi:hypothetical protein